MNRKNPSKAQLQRANERLQRAAKREHADADRARDAMLASDRMRDNALQLLGEIAPDLLNLMVRPTYLKPDPRLPVVRSYPRMRMSHRDLLRGLPPAEQERCIDHWITRMRFEIESNPERYDGCRMLCFRIQRPKGKDSLAWMHAFDDRMIDHSPTGLRWMIMGMAERLCDELEQKIGGGRG